MRQLSFLARRMWCGWFFISSFLSFLPLYPFFKILLLREEWFPIVWKLKKVWGHWMIWSTGIIYQVKFEEPLDKNTAYVICPNHSSYLDIILTNLVFPNYFHFMGKAELRNVPLFRIFFKDMNIAVNRSSITASHKAYTRARNDLRKGISLAIYPEATIPEHAPILAPFKNGAFRIAIEEQVPVVPITFLDNWRLFPDSGKERFLVRPGISRVIIHAPIPTRGMTDKEIPQLRDTVYTLITRTMVEKGVIKR